MPGCLQFTKICLATLVVAIGLASCAAAPQGSPAPDVQLPNGSNSANDTPVSKESQSGPSMENLATSSNERTKKPDTPSRASSRLAKPIDAPVKLTSTQKKSGSGNNNYILGAITRIRQTGKLQHASLTEVSGLSASLTTPGVLFALNDSGNPATVYAFSEQGAHLGEWPINATNRDWEDMSSIWLNGQAYLIIGDTGDNLKLHRSSILYLIEEPTLQSSNKSALTPTATLNFTFEDGPRNIEAFAVANDSIFLISKEPVTADGPSASHLYELSIPTQISNELLVAKKVASLPLARSNFESKLAAVVAGIDLNHITSLDIDVSSNSAYLLTYRHVIHIQRQDNQTWAEAFSKPGKRIYSHNLEQAEALAVAVNRAVWITSEKRLAPLWAIPISPPL